MASSKADMYIGLYPERTSDYVWFQPLTIGTRELDIASSDPNFFIGAYYYLTILSTESKARGYIQIFQDREISSLVDGVIRKDNYWTNSELVKFYVFEFPYSKTEESYDLTLSISSLSPEFHPLILVNQLEFTKQQTDYSTFMFPTVERFETAFGDEVITTMDKTSVSISLK